MKSAPFTQVLSRQFAKDKELNREKKMPPEKINQNHRDMFSKFSLAMLIFLGTTTITGIIAVISNPPVFADDFDAKLAPIIQAQKLQTETNRELTKSINDIGLAVKDGHVRYIEDKIIDLEVTAVGRELNQIETDRLLRLKADLTRIKK